MQLGSAGWGDWASGLHREARVMISDGDGDGDGGCALRPNSNERAERRAGRITVPSVRTGRGPAEVSR